MKSLLRNVVADGISYTALMFVCPGCVAGGTDGYEGVHSLPVNSDLSTIGRPSWIWDENLEAPTLSPSILTHGYKDPKTGDMIKPRCHSFLKAGVFEFLSDSEHSLSGQKVPIPDLPEWVERLD